MRIFFTMGDFGIPRWDCRKYGHPAPGLPAGALAEEGLPELEKRMRELIKQNLEFKKEKISFAEAKKIFSASGGKNQ